MTSDRHPPPPRTEAPHWEIAAGLLGVATLGALLLLEDRERGSGGRALRRDARQGRLAPKGAPTPPTGEALLSSASPEPEGREARSPRAFPARAWRDIILRVKDEIADDRVLIVAAGVTFYAILSLFPLLTSFVAIYGLFADRAAVAGLTSGLAGVVPAEALVLISEQLDRLLEVEPETLTFAWALGLAIALWSATGGTKGIIEALNVAYDEHEERSFLRLNLLAISMTLGGMAMVAVLLALSAVVPLVVGRFPSGPALDTLIIWGRWLVMALIMVGVLAVLYRYGPDRRFAKWRWVTPGAVFAALGVMAVSAGFAFWTERFASYGETYGSLGTVVAVMIWLWLAAVVVIVGAEINAEAEHQTARDSTIGPDLPMGLRDAEMADNVAPPRWVSQADMGFGPRR